jgi:hypothetical protein
MSTSPIILVPFPPEQMLPFSSFRKPEIPPAPAPAAIQNNVSSHKGLSADSHVVDQGSRQNQQPAE